ncbi:hypothetical protein DSECCO2_611800 [anaerobic digester metagenome]
MLQTKVVPGTSDVAVRVVLSPSQICGFTGVMVTTGFGFTVTVTESTFEQSGAKIISSIAKSFPFRMRF